MSSGVTPLWQQITAVTQRALHSGALQPIATTGQEVADGGMSFWVRILDSLARKEAVQRSRQSTGGGADNPFLPYEEDLLVTVLSPTHVCLLNKFKVVEHHLLMVTRHYESQDSWLTLADFEAFVRCLSEVDGLGFYNGGRQAGASQHHKHLQLVPLATHSGQLPLPIATLMAAHAVPPATPVSLPALPFCHSLYRFQQPWQQTPTTAAHLHQVYQHLMAAIGAALEAPQPDIPYNLLLTRQWMMAVPRSQESYQGIGVNSLGYAGWLLVKTTADLDTLKQLGPMTLLQKVGRQRVETRV